MSKSIGRDSRMGEDNLLRHVMHRYDTNDMDPNPPEVPLAFPHPARPVFPVGAAGAPSDRG